jgi:hypothetical protein
VTATLWCNSVWHQWEEGLSHWHALLESFGPTNWNKQILMNVTALTPDYAWAYEKTHLNLVCILLHVWDQVMGVFIPSTQLHYRRLILVLNTTYTATCFGRMTIFRQKYISYDYSTDNNRRSQHQLNSYYIPMFLTVLVSMQPLEWILCSPIYDENII